MIEFRDVRKTFTSQPSLGRPPQTIVAIDDVTLEIPGGVWAAVGPNGAGKTTLFGLLLGFLRPSGGEVRVGGREPRSYVRRHGAGYLPERFRLPPEWRVRAALRALARLDGLRGAAAARRVDDVLERLGLGPYGDRRAGTLSRGLRQRLGLAQALLAPRELVVLDEPTSGLDPLWRIRFRGIVRELVGDGRTVLLASHDLGEVERMADRVILLEDGRIRDVLDARPGGEAPTRYRLELAEPTPAVDDVFPGAHRIEGATAWVVGSGGPTELSDRLAALIAAGGVVVSVRPLPEPLEERVQRALGRGEAS